MAFKANTLVIGFVAVGMVGVQADRNLNYVDAEAVINSVTYECTVEKGKRYLEHKSTKEKAYMDCTLAKIVAPQFDYSEKDVKYHANLDYSWTSPVDGTVQTISKRKNARNEETYKKGQIIMVGAHKKDALKSYIK